MKFFKYLIQTDNSDGPDYGVATEAELIAKLRKIAEDTAACKRRPLPPILVEAFERGRVEMPHQTAHQALTEPAGGDAFMDWLNWGHDEGYCLPPADLTVSWEHEPRVQALADSLDAALTEADEMKSEGFPEPGWGPEARAAFDGARVNPSPLFSPELIAKSRQRVAKCPQCGSTTVQPRESEEYCEECGWPDENRAEARTVLSEADKDELARLERAIYESGVDGGEATSDAIEALKTKEEALGLFGLTESPRWI